MRGIGRKVFDFYWGTGIADDVPALTYYLLLSLGPFALGIAAIQASLLKDVVSAFELAGQINAFLPDAVHNDVERLVIGTRENSPYLVLLAIVAMLWTSSGAIGVIERCESRILDCPRHDIVRGRIRNFGLGALVAIGFVTAAASAPVIGDALRWLSLGDTLGGGIVRVLNTLGSVLVFALIYRYAPRSRMSWRAVIVGALPAGIALQAIPALVGAYFGAAAGFAAVRLFLLLAVLLAGLYIMALVMLVGSGLAVSTERRVRAGRAERAKARKERARPAQAPRATTRGSVSMTASKPSSATGEVPSTAYSGAGPRTS